MISEIKYLIRKTNKKLATGLLVLAVVLVAFPISATNAVRSRSNWTSSYMDGSGGQSPMDVYSPGGRNRPAIIFVHGGGWRSGDKSQYASLGQSAAQRGYVGISINYRLGSGGVYYQYEDVLRAVLTVRANARSYGVDPNRIAVWGDSAGGSLAMRVAASGETGLAAAVGWSAPTNAYTGMFNSVQSFGVVADHSICMATAPAEIANAMNAYFAYQGSKVSVAPPTQTFWNANTPSYYNPATTYALSSARTAAATAVPAWMASPTTAVGTPVDPNAQRWILAMADARGCRDNLRALSPAVTASRYTPPTFLVNSQSEYLVNPQQATEYAAKLNSMGIDSQALILPGANHLGYDARAVEPTFNFLNQHLRP